MIRFGPLRSRPQDNWQFRYLEQGMERAAARKIRTSPRGSQACL